MQPSTVPHTWQEFFWLSLAIILSSAGTWFGFKRKQQQSDAETERTDAEADRTRAQTRSIDLNTTMHAGDMMLDLIKLSAQAALDVERLRKEKEFWQGRAEQLKAETELLQMQLDRAAVKNKLLE